MYKGFSCTNSSATAVNALIGGTLPYLLKTSFGDHLVNPPAYNPGPGGTVVKMAVSAAFIEDGWDPQDPSYWLLAMQEDIWSGYVLLGNEPYDQDPIDWWNSWQGKGVYDTLMGIPQVTGKPPTRMLIPGGLLAGDHANFPAWAPNSWVTTLMNYLGDLKKIRGLHWHLYPNEFGYNINQATTAMNTYIQSYEALWDKDLLNFISEIGRPDDSPATQYNPLNVSQEAGQHGVDAWFWYRQQITGGSGDNYFMLQNPNSTLTAYGTQFKNI